MPRRRETPPLSGNHQEMRLVVPRTADAAAEALQVLLLKVTGGAAADAAAGWVRPGAAQNWWCCCRRGCRLVTARRDAGTGGAAVANAVALLRQAATAG